MLQLASNLLTPLAREFMAQKVLTTLTRTRGAAHMMGGPPALAALPQLRYNITSLN